ncbi:PQQ-dependent sugar dehydrogenase [Candidatus Gracilibacteria bacterium]|nr:PQQ-dependent sugar dehydrogenase [Candidatus Gracilibacteria bacterium]
MKKTLLILGTVVFLGLAYALVQYLALDSKRIPPTNEAEETPQTMEYEIVEVVRGLDVPWSIAFTSPTRILVTERSGSIRVIENGVLSEKPLIQFSEVSSNDEEGLMSLALDPDYENNKYMYTSYAYRGKNGMAVKVVRLTDRGDALTDTTVILDDIPAAKYHAGSRLAFGPDGKLYISTGDGTDKTTPQNLKSLGGKILRINADGTIPADNPREGNPVWSYGHRNPQGLSWIGEQMYSSEHGPSVFDGPAGGDEVNKIEKGGNYGWPLVSHLKTREGTVAPLRVFTPAEAPASLMAYSGEMFPQYEGHLFFGALKGEGIVVLSPEGDGLALIGKIATSYGRIREVVEAPDGSIYFSTSNRDGRGTLQAGDDKIYRIQKIRE